MPSFAGAEGNEVAGRGGLRCNAGRCFDCGSNPGRSAAWPSASTRSEGCSSCHILERARRRDRPRELTRVGSMRGSSFLRKQFLTPGRGAPAPGRDRRRDRGRFTIGLMFKAVTKDGQTIEGVRMTQDTFGIVLKDVTGHFHALSNSDLSVARKRARQGVSCRVFKARCLPPNLTTSSPTSPA